MRRSLAIVSVCLTVAAIGASGCQRLRAEAGAERARKEELAAIKAYSEASDRANVAHRALLDAFDRANRSASLESYREALGTAVLPALDTFIAQLEAVPTGTPRLQEVHAILLDAYKEARKGIAEFAGSLEERSQLGAFDALRARLQARVTAYREALRDYYRANHVELRLEADAQAAGGSGASQP